MIRLLHSFISSFIPSFIHSFIHSFIWSFIYSSAEHGKTFFGVIGGYCVVTLITIDPVVPGIMVLLMIIGIAYYEDLVFCAVKFYVEHIALVGPSVWEIYPADYYSGK